MRDTPQALMLFAAGFGTRMKHLTADQPKPMIPVAGKPLVDHALGLVRDAEIDTIVANLHYKPEVLKAHLAPQNVKTIVEHPQILETGGGLRNALPLLGDGPVYTLNSDAIWQGPNPLKMLRDAWNPAGMDALMICIPTANALGHTGTGDFTLGENGRLVRGPGVIFGGVQIIKTDLLHDIALTSFSLNLVWDQMLAAGRISGLSYSGKWCDVGHPDGIALAETLVKSADV